MSPLLQYVLEHFGVAVAAATGVLAARGKRIDLFGVTVLAWVTAFGGGTMRDAVLGAFPVFWVKDPNYVLTAAAAAAAVFYGGRSQPLPPSVLLVVDAFALALFSIVGVDKAMSLGTSPVIGMVMGVMTGVAGGILRDVLLGEIPIVFRRETCLYATASLLGCMGYLALEPVSPAGRSRTIVGVLAILVLRLAGIRWRLSLPDFVPVDREEPARKD